MGEEGRTGLKTGYKFLFTPFWGTGSNSYSHGITCE